ncbi:MAG: sulfur carrier protein ThiS [Shewanella sp.]|nr:sulfur carrier protein ThiS [Shewanella sp.]MCF1430954.1 sulfur carrier protein ThiS [Shewanella sp.]MCF1438956.1 sulfur carrier protein ThiS [Shewanella sp.]MCF1458126.1 sulfur carrier protein ThiS [Shewanella sp.]
MLIQVNDRQVELPNGSDIAAVFEVLQLAPLGHALAINGQVLPKSQWQHTRLNAGDELAVFQVIAGG